MELFNEKMQAYIDNLDLKKRAKYTIKKDTYETILRVLKAEETNDSAKFRFWAKKTFMYVTIGAKEFVYNKKTNLPVVMHEDLFDKLQECHLAVGHSGRDKTWAEVWQPNLSFEPDDVPRSSKNIPKFLNRPFLSSSACATFVKFADLFQSRSAAKQSYQSGLWADYKSIW